MAVNSKAMASVRAKRSGIILEMGLLRREGNTFWVGSTTQKNAKFQVWRDDSGQVHCTCADFSELGGNDHSFRCEHILAVREYLDQKKQSEAEMKKNNIHVRAEAENLEATRNKDVDVNEPEKSEAEPPATVTKMDFPRLLTRLSQPFPANDIKRRYGWSDQQGNAHYVDYVEWHTVADFLDQTYPSWSHAVKNVQQIGDFVAVTVAITIDSITREGVGTGAAYSEMGIKKAEHDALKRAAVKFGVARGLYKDLDEESEVKTATLPRDPLAKDLDDLVTPRQLVAIKAISAAASINPDQECHDLMKCDPKELSRKAASAFIDHLKAKQLQAQTQNDLRKAG